MAVLFDRKINFHTPKETCMPASPELAEIGRPALFTHTCRRHISGLAFGFVLCLATESTGLGGQLSRIRQ